MHPLDYMTNIQQLVTYIYLNYEKFGIKGDLLDIQLKSEDLASEMASNSLNKNWCKVNVQELTKKRLWN
jgi:hypothetical protein